MGEEAMGQKAEATHRWMRELQDYTAHLPEEQKLAFSETLKNLEGTIEDLGAEAIGDNAAPGSEARFKRIFDQSPIGSAIVGTDFRFVIVNESLCTILGYPKKELLGLRFGDVTHPDHKSEDVAQVQRLLAGEIERYTTDKRFIRKDGNVVWAHVSVTVARDNEGRPLYLLPLIEDITEDKKAEIELRESEERYRRLFEVESDALVLVDNETGRIMEVNSTALDLYGYSRDEWLGMKHTDVSVEPEKTQHAAATRQTRVPLRWHRKKDGTIFPVEITGCHFDWKGRFVHVAAIRDITERKLIEDELTKSEEKYRTLIEHLQVGVIVHAPDSRVLFCNPRAAALFGAASEQLSGRKVTDFTWQFTRPDGSPMPLEEHPVNQVMTSQQMVQNFVLGIDRGVGPERLWVVGNCFPEMDETGQLYRIVLTFGDITEWKLAEEKVQKLNRDLEKRVQERTSELSAANLELESFAYSISHDLRAPLRGIDGWSLAVLEDYGDQLDPTARDYLATVRAETKLMAQLIDALLQMSRVTRAEMCREKVDLGELALAIAIELRRVEPERKVELVVAPDLIAEGDPLLLRAVLQNLLGNAWKFTKNTERACVEVGKGEKEGETVFFVRDNGAGFDINFAHKLFVPFQRLHSKDDYPGTGIGLATVRRIINRHGGAVWAEGEVGKNATFFFKLG